MPNFVVTRTPLRVSFAGGGTDFESFFRIEGGQVVSTAINRYIYVTVKTHDSTLNPEKFRLNYYDSEHVNDRSEIQNRIIKETLMHVGFDQPLYIATVGDVPASSGLGSSSAFTVGLLNALYTLRGERLSPAALAEEACAIEIERLNGPIGKQDQYATALGDFNIIKFQIDGSVSFEPLRLSVKDVETLYDNLMFFSTGVQRSANEILTEQAEKIESGSSVEKLKELKEISRKVIQALKGGPDVGELGRLMHQSWEIKKALAHGITEDWVDSIYEKALNAGALGGKLNGAGGGGFFMFVAPPEKHVDIRKALSELVQTRFFYEPSGTRVLATN